LPTDAGRVRRRNRTGVRRAARRHTFAPRHPFARSARIAFLVPERTLRPIAGSCRRCLDPGGEQQCRRDVFCVACV